MRNLAPEIVRKRLLMEGYFSIEMTKESLKSYLLDMAAHLNLRTYGEPVIYSPEAGMGKDENAGFDAFVPTAEGRITAKLDGKEHNIFPVAISSGEGQALSRWIQKEKPVTLLEVGLGYGFATLHAVEGLLSAHQNDFQITTIDPNQQRRFSNLALQLLAEVDALSRVKHLSEASELVLPNLLKTFQRYDFAILDGGHLFDGVFVDLFYIGQLLHPGRVIFVDDLQLPAIAKAVSFFKSNLGWKLEEISTECEDHHWAVVRTADPAPVRKWDFYVDF